MRAPLAMASALLLALALAGGRPPKQYGGLVDFDPGGVAHRMQVLCSLGLAPDAAVELCGAPKKPNYRLVERPERPLSATASVIMPPDGLVEIEVPPSPTAAEEPEKLHVSGKR